LLELYVNLLVINGDIIFFVFLVCPRVVPPDIAINTETLFFKLHLFLVVLLDLLLGLLQLLLHLL
jgi:hypothetical protein